MSQMMEVQNQRGGEISLASIINQRECLISKDSRVCVCEINWLSPVSLQPLREAGPTTTHSGVVLSFVLMVGEEPNGHSACHHPEEIGLKHMTLSNESVC